MSADVVTNPTEWAGYRNHVRNRQTGTLVVLVKSDEQGVNVDDPETKWTLICDDHDMTMGFATRKLAESFMPSPSDWCEQCGAMPAPEASAR